MIDFHSHVLPAMDDGAKDTDMSLAMLRLAARQGARAVVASPHFYPGRDTVDSFLARRQRCCDVLCPLLTEDCPPLLLGAEVQLREGLSRVDLRPLCLQGTDVLLVELPFMRMPYWLLEELENIILGQRLTVMLAHLDRYMPWYKNSESAMLADLPELLVQLNAESLVDRRCLRQLVKWLPETVLPVIGSDMHNMDTRAPQLDQALAVLSRNRVGRNWLARMRDRENAILGYAF